MCQRFHHWSQSIIMFSPSVTICLSRIGRFTMLWYIKTYKIIIVIVRLFEMQYFIKCRYFFLQISWNVPMTIWQLLHCVHFFHFIDKDFAMDGIFTTTEFILSPLRFTASDYPFGIFKLFLTLWYCWLLPLFSVVLWIRSCLKCVRKVFKIPQW
jgi:hypothetical protein